MPTPPAPRHWKAELADIVRDPAELVELLQLPADAGAEIEAACTGFALRVPRPYLSRIAPADPRDPLLLQVLPRAEEHQAAAHELPDPLQEQQFSPLPGLLHKYAGRVLVVLSGSCPIHCRYCFRRQFPYAEARIGPEQWRDILDYIAADDSIAEVIFSGGEPLNLTDAALARKVADLDAITHLRRLRIHTRQPLMIPQRIDANCQRWMRATRLQLTVVLHSNHPRETDAEVARALAGLRDAGATLLNQAVLLRGVNDSADTLAALCETLFEHGVLPYYLHQLDPVEGTSHFAVSLARARELRAQLQARLPGYLVPRLAQELAHEPNKTLL